MHFSVKDSLTGTFLISCCLQVVHYIVSTIRENAKLIKSTLQSYKENKTIHLKTNRHVVKFYHLMPM